MRENRVCAYGNTFDCSVMVSVTPDIRRVHEENCDDDFISCQSECE